VNENILVACIGNIFLGDDGFGFEVARALAGSALPPAVEIRDYGIRGLDLAYALLRPWKAVILVDAVARGGSPGTLYLLQPDNAAPAAGRAALDPHSMDPVSVLAAARSLGPVTAGIYILGCEPQNLAEEAEGRMGLSPPVITAVPEAVRMIYELTCKLTQAAVSQQAA
jgi:hydrogenase maturation protease